MGPFSNDYHFISATAALRLDYHGVLQRTRRQDTDNVIATNVPESFSAPHGTHAIRYRLTTPELHSTATALLVLTYTTRIPQGRITHISIVNSDVSDGMLWEVQPPDSEGTFTLATTINAPLHEVVIYITLDGAVDGIFRIDALHAWELNRQRPLRMAFVIDPWVERSDPRWKADYIWWLGQFDKSLRHSGLDVQAHYIIGDHVEPLWPQFRPYPEATHTAIRTQQLLRLYGGHREGLVDQRRLMCEAGTNERRAAFIDLLRSAVPFEPDIVIAISDMQILRDAFPSSLVLYRDALYCREPFPDELTSLDPFGLYHNSSLSRIVENGPRSLLYSEVIDGFFPKERDVLSLLAKHGLAEGAFLLLPLQDSRHVNFFDESCFSDQLDMLVTCLTRFPDTPLLVTQHPDRREITPEAMAALVAQHPTLHYISEFERFTNPTARILPFAGGVAGVSTGLLIQALLLGKPIYNLGRHALENSVRELSTTEDRRRLGFALLMRYFSSYRYLHDGRWLATRFAVLDLWRRGQLSSSALAIDLPGNVIRALQAHARQLPSIPPIPRLPMVAANSPWNAEIAFSNVHEQLHHRVDLLKLVRDQGVGIELGVAEGHFSRELLAQQRLSHLFGVDMYAGDRGHDEWQYLRALHQLGPYRQSQTLIRSRFDRAAQLFPDGYFDFIYVDGYAHDGVLCEATYAEWYPKLRPGGVFGGHDYTTTFPLVVQAVDRFASRYRLTVHVINDRSGGWNFNAPSWFVIKPS